MHELIAIAYRDETTADRAFDELQRSAEWLRIDPDAASVLICERDGSCRLTTSRHGGATTHWSAFWGALLEALLDDGRPTAIDGDSRRRLRSLLVPGTSMLLVAAAPPAKRSVLDALSQFGGDAVGCTLPAEPAGAADL